MTVVIEKTKTGYRAFVEEVRGIYAACETIEETIASLRERLLLYFTNDPTAIPLTYKSYGLDRSKWIHSTVPVLMGD